MKMIDSLAWLMVNLNARLRVVVLRPCHSHSRLDHWSHVHRLRSIDERRHYRHLRVYTRLP